LLSEDGSFQSRPDIAIVVFGEQPYAEFAGDRKNLLFDDEEGLELLRKFKAEAIPAVAVFLSGRPLWINRELNAADAFVASWLPGSEGDGLADVLFGKREATGRLSFSWPARCIGTPVNGVDGALFRLGYGLSLSDSGDFSQLDESCALQNGAAATDWYGNGRIADGIVAKAGGVELPNLRGQGGGITARGIDKERQEDAREIAFDPGTELTIAQDGEGVGGFRILYAIAERPRAPVTLKIGETAIDITSQLAHAEGKGWREMVITAKCAPGLGDGITIASGGSVTLSVAAIARQDMPEGTECSF
jgi:beta-glucosidase